RRPCPAPGRTDRAGTRRCPRSMREQAGCEYRLAAESSFDIVSKLDRQEVDNALNQAAKEVAQRFDFKGTGTTIAWQGENGVEITSSSEERTNAALDVFRSEEHTSELQSRFDLVCRL